MLKLKENDSMRSAPWREDNPYFRLMVVDRGLRVLGGFDEFVSL